MRLLCIAFQPYLVERTLFVRFVDMKISNNEACTTIMVGSGMMADGSMVYGRSDDSNAVKATRLAVYPDTDEGPEEFVALDSPFRLKLPPHRLGFSALERAGLPYHWGEAGFNSLGVGMSGTETIFASGKVLSLDPYVEDGIGENSVVQIVLPYIASAREGVERLGALIEEKGSAEGFGVAFLDEKEMWYLENAGGHRYLACRMPQDKYFVSGNQSRYRRYNPADKENYIASKDLIEFAQQNALFEGEFDFHEAYSLESENDKTYNYPRVRALQKLFTPSVETDVKVNDFPVWQKADRLLTIEDIKEAFRHHYNGTEHDPYLHSNPREPYRPISIFRTINTHILQVRPALPKEIGRVDYMAEGMADLSVFLPLYQGVKSYPYPYTVGTVHSEADSAYWTFRKVSALGMINYNGYAPLIKKTFSALEAQIQQMQVGMEEEYLATCKTRPLAAGRLLQQFSDEALNQALTVARQLLEELFTQLTKDIQKEYFFHGA